MKTKVEFEKSDFKEMGQMVVRNNPSANLADPQYLASVAYKICYSMNTNAIYKVSLADGRIFKYCNISSLLNTLNNDPRGYRPMTTEECIAVAKVVGNRFGTEGNLP